MSASTPNIYSEIVTRLKSAGRKEIIVDLLNGVLYSALALVSVMLVATVFEGVMYFPVIVRTIMFWVCIAIASALLVPRVVLPLLRLAGVLAGESVHVTANKVGGRFPSIRDHLVNILQLFQERDSHRLFSPDLIDASFADARK